MRNLIRTKKVYNIDSINNVYSKYINFIIISVHCRAFEQSLPSLPWTNLFHVLFQNPTKTKFQREKPLFHFWKGIPMTSKAHSWNGEVRRKKCRCQARGRRKAVLRPSILISSLSPDNRGANPICIEYSPAAERLFLLISLRRAPALLFLLPPKFSHFAVERNWRDLLQQQRIIFPAPVGWLEFCIRRFSSAKVDGDICFHLCGSHKLWQNGNQALTWHF